MSAFILLNFIPKPWLAFSQQNRYFQLFFLAQTKYGFNLFDEKKRWMEPFKQQKKDQKTSGFSSRVATTTKKPSDAKACEAT